MAPAELDLVVRARRIVTPGGEVAGWVGVRGGRIAGVGRGEAAPVARSVEELGDGVVLLPGLVDSHVHVNEPGRTEWEGFATATRAAAAGGVTTIVDMPLNCVPPTVDVAALELKRKVARDQCFVDVGFWGGAVPGNLAQLRELHEAGVFGFKCFLLHSGVPEFPQLDARQLEAALRELAGFDALMLVHAEDSVAIDRAPGASGASYRRFLASRPRGAENVAIAQLIELARWTRARAHVLHLSSSDALPMIASARRDGLRVTAETCPHYLFFSAEQVPDGATQFKCCPPIREADNREELWQGLARGTIDSVVSDHSPCTPDLKRLDSGDFGTAWGGISSLQLGLPAVWTAARARGIGLDAVVRWMAERPARLAGMRGKGRIEAGCDADLVAFAPGEELVVDASLLRHRHPLTPYAGLTLRGVVRATWLRGRRVDDGEPRGQLLARGQA